MAKFEESVLSQLRSSGMDKAQLSALAKSAAQINAAGLKSARILTKGTPVPDSLRISGIADKAAISKLLESIISRTERLGGIRVFPYGIPRPDLFRVDIDIGPGGPIG